MSDGEQLAEGSGWTAWKRMSGVGGVVWGEDADSRDGGGVVGRVLDGGGGRGRRARGRARIRNCLVALPAAGSFDDILGGVWRGERYGKERDRERVEIDIIIHTPLPNSRPIYSGQPRKKMAPENLHSCPNPNSNRAAPHIILGALIVCPAGLLLVSCSSSSRQTFQSRTNHFPPIKLLPSSTSSKNAKTQKDPPRPNAHRLRTAYRQPGRTTIHSPPRKSQRRLPRIRLKSRRRPGFTYHPIRINDHPLRPPLCGEKVTEVYQVCSDRWLFGRAGWRVVGYDR